MADIRVIVYWVPRSPVVTSYSLYFNTAPPSGPLPTQPETNPHFIARHRAPAFNVLSLLRQASARDVPQEPLVANPHFVGRFTPPAYYRQPYITTGVPTSGPLPTQPETQPHFVGRFVPVTHYVLRSLRENIVPPQGTQAETQPHFIGRFTAPIFARFNYNLTARDAPAAVVETQPHFIGRFTPPAYNVLIGLRQNGAPTTPAVVQAETQPHFIGRFTQPAYNVLLALRQNTSVDYITDSNTHFVAEPWRTTWWQTPALRQNVPSDTTTAAVVETNQHYVPRTWPVVYSVLAALRQNVVPPSGPLPLQPETQPHFLGKFTAPTFARFRYNLTPQDGSIAAQPETPTYFIGKFNPAKHNVLLSLRQNVVPPSGPLPTQSETQTYFIAKPWPVVLRVAPPLRQNVPFDAPTQADPHTLGHFAQPAFSRFNYNFTPADVPPPIQPGGNPHFVGKFAAPTHILLPGMRQTIAADISIQPPSNPHHVGRFTAPQHIVLQLLRGPSNNDVPPPPQPETNTHFVPRFSQPQHFLLRPLFGPSNNDEPPPPPPDSGANPHFVGKFTPPAFSIFWNWLQGVGPAGPSHIQPIGCVIYGRACDCGDVHHPLTFYQGATWQIQGHLSYADGTPFDLGDGCQIMWALGDNLTGVVTLELTLGNGITVVSPTEGICRLLIPSEQSLTVPLGRYTDQLRAVDPTGYVSDMWTGPITVAESFFT